MKQIGVIDLKEWDAKKEDWAENISIHLFSGRHAFEKTVTLATGAAPSGELNGIEIFHLSVPIGVLNFRRLKLPFSDRQKLREIIPFELDSLVLGGSATVVHDFLVLEGAENNFDILIAYMDNHILKDILTRLASMKIDPEIVTSLELQAVMNKGTTNLAERLTGFEALSADERIKATKAELSANTLNLRTGQFAYTRDTEKTNKTLKATAFLALLLSLVINAGLLLGYVSAKKETSSIKRDVRNTYSALFPSDKKITDEVYQLKAHIKELRDRDDMLAGVRPLGFMFELSQRTTQGTVFSEVTLDKDLVTIKGEAASMNITDILKKKLSEFLTEASITDLKPEDNGRVYFTIIARLRPQ